MTERRALLAVPSPLGSAAYRHAYVHVPFCRRRCSYCDFAIAVRRATPVDDFVRALRAELAARSATIDRSAGLETLYLGGGTPSRLGGEGVARVIDVVCQVLQTQPGAEVTVEANPEDVTLESVRAWMGAGVNRVSLGVQSFSADVLRWMHRTHDVDAVFRAVEALATGGLDNWSLDLIYALPDEVERDWTRELREAIALGPAHLSAYGLTVEEGTPLARWRSRGEVHTAADERYERDFLEAHAVLEAAGYHHYEVSNWGRTGRESRHNSSYWRGVPYLGLGPGAHGFDGVTRRWNEREYVRWHERALAGEDPHSGHETLTREQRSLEQAYLGLRTRRGLGVREGDEPLLARWTDAGWATVEEGRVRLSATGWLRLDALVRALTEHRSRY